MPTALRRCCSHVKGGSFLEGGVDDAGELSLRQRMASRRLLPSLCLQASRLGQLYGDRRPLVTQAGNEKGRLSVPPFVPSC